mmetsp:Transcript_38209/g.91479  ORF Transcript_38209/g.91479 Transcript_38209/m.91479 type:complete len:215 (+) Transcript_38209:1965-2609(+)
MAISVMDTDAPSGMPEGPMAADDPPLLEDSSSRSGSIDPNAALAAPPRSDDRRAPMARCGRRIVTVPPSSPPPFFLGITSASASTAGRPSPLLMYRRNARYASPSSLLSVTSDPSGEYGPAGAARTPRWILAAILIICAISSSSAPLFPSSPSMGGKYETSHRSPYRSTATNGRVLAARTDFDVRWDWFLSRRSAPMAAYDVPGAAVPPAPGME